MSSILDALKKAERESTSDRGANTPWPSPPAVQPPYRRNIARWRVAMGVVAGLCVAGALYWYARRPDTARSAFPVAAPAPSRPSPDRQAPSVSGKLKPDTRVSGQAPVRPAPARAADPVTARQPFQAPEKPLQAAAPAATPMVQSPPPVSENPPQTAAGTKTEPPPALPALPIRGPADQAAADGQPIPGFPESAKTFRQDPRIDLQALVWAPQAAERFVVINNRLIKEGGSVDKIVVLTINPDDVLLAEGTDRWHEAFQIR